MLITLLLQTKQQKSQILNNLLKTAELTAAHTGFVVKQLTLQSLFLSIIAHGFRFCISFWFESNLGIGKVGMISLPLLWLSMTKQN